MENEKKKLKKLGEKEKNITKNVKIRTYWCEVLRSSEMEKKLFYISSKTIHTRDRESSEIFSTYDLVLVNSVPEQLDAVGSLHHLLSRCHHQNHPLPLLRHHYHQIPRGNQSMRLIRAL